VAWAILLLLQGLLPVATVYLTKLLVDSLVRAIEMGEAWESVRTLLVPGGLMAGVLVLTELFKSALNWIRAMQSELVRDCISSLVHQQSVAVDFSFYELPEYHDRLHQARSDASSRPLALLESSGSLVQNSITLLAMAAVLLSYAIWLPLVLFLSALPAFAIALRFNRRYHRWWQQTTPDRRRADYYELLLTNSVSAAEVRLFDLGDRFESAYQSLRQRLRRERLKLIGEQSLAQLGASASAVVISGAATIWMVWRALQGWVGLGDLALFYQAFNRGQSLMRSLLGNAGQIYTNSLFLGNLFEFLKLEPQIADPPHPLPIPSPLRQGISFQQVTFRYPGSQRAALQDFNLTIPAGQIVAIVGANGAGKSTLIKLLCRFYDPESGAITWDGVDIRRFSVRELRRMLTVLFQFPVTYQMSVAENIALGEVGLSESDIEAAAQAAGANETIARLPRGYETLLGKWFAGGTDLSGGEWQRLALARAFARQAPILVLDEPTTFMDSWAEADWLDRFRSLSERRTALIITHRFILAMRADVIHVMDEGQIVESGSHEELLAQGGLYAQSWAAQMQAGSRSLV
jgi:ATP-binding cassette subfamily B protein